MWKFENLTALPLERGKLRHVDRSVTEWRHLPGKRSVIARSGATKQSRVFFTLVGLYPGLLHSVRNDERRCLDKLDMTARFVIDYVALRRTLFQNEATRSEESVKALCKANYRHSCVSRNP